MDFESTGYQIYYLDRRHVNIEREVVFDRTTADAPVTIEISDDEQPVQPRGGVGIRPKERNEGDEAPDNIPDAPENPEPPRNVQEEEEEEEEPPEAPEPQPQRRARRTAATHEE